MTRAIRRARTAVTASLFLALVFGADPAAAQYVLRDDPTGGDCEPGGIGAWSPAEKRCRLTADLQGTIELGADGIALDGAGHVLTPRPGDVAAVQVDGRRGTITENVVARGFSVGIRIQGGSGNRVVRSTSVAGAPAPGAAVCGILLDGTTGAEVAENTIEDSRGSGICLVSSTRNRVTSNRVRRVSDAGIELTASNENWITRNEVRGGPGLPSRGLFLFASRDNAIVFNVVSDHGGAAVEISTSDRQRTFFNVLSSSPGGGVVIDHGNHNLTFCNDSSATSFGFDVSAGSAGNIFWMNNLYGDDTARDAAGAALGNLFALAPPAGGNYWKENAPFCIDANGDRFCDLPHPFLGNQDVLPWLNPIPWRLLPEICLLDGPILPDPPPPSSRPPIEAALAIDARALLRAVERLASGDGTTLAAGLAADAALLDDAKLVTGRAAVVAALASRTACHVGPVRLRMSLLPSAANDGLVSLTVEPCDRPAFRLVGRFEDTEQPAPRRLRRLLVESIPPP